MPISPWTSPVPPSSNIDFAPRLRVVAAAAAQLNLSFCIPALKAAIIVTVLNVEPGM